MRNARRLRGIGIATMALLVAHLFSGDTVSSDRVGLAQASAPEARSVPAPQPRPPEHHHAQASERKTNAPSSTGGTAASPELPRAALHKVAVMATVSGRAAHDRNSQPTISAPKRDRSTAVAIGSLIPPTTPHHESVTKLQCTAGRDFPDGYFLFTACKDKDDVMYRLASSTPGGWEYGMVAVDGVIKCGWIEEDTIRTLKAPPAAKICESYEAPLKHPSTHFSKVNCPPGECSGPEWIKLPEECDHRVFANFATSTRSALNVVPNSRNSGFSLYIGTQAKHILWRGDFMQTSKDGSASDVLSDQLHAWGMMSTQCTEEAAYSETQVVWHSWRSR